MNVTVQTEPPDAPIFITSTYADLVCELDIDSSDGVAISFTWSGPNGIVRNGADYTITDEVDSSTLRINGINVSRDNNANYTCSVTTLLSNETGQGHIVLYVQGMLACTVKECICKC